MSKSLGNGIDPKIVIEGGKNQKKEPPYGADVLRLWVSSADYSSDVPISKNILKQMGDIYGKIRNTARFLLGNLHDFDPAKDAVPYEQLPQLDRYMLHRMTEVLAEVTAAFENFQFFRFFQAGAEFLCGGFVELLFRYCQRSALYQCPRCFPSSQLSNSTGDRSRKFSTSDRTVLCHMAEDIWQYLPYSTPTNRFLKPAG